MNCESAGKNKAVFFDRDGVINPLVHNPDTGMHEPPHELRDFAIFPRVLKSLRMLKDAGFMLFVVSNQPDIAKGKTTPKKLEAIEERLWEFSRDNGGLFEECYYCHHHPDGVVPGYAKQCDCRKPGTAFLEQAVERFELEPRLCWMVGDRDTDVLCGAKMGFGTVKIDNPHEGCGEAAAAPDAMCADIYEAALVILEKDGRDNGV